MNEPGGTDPIDRLRATNPTHVADVPSASLARVSASVQEHIMTSDQALTPTPARRGRNFALLSGAALTGVLVLVVAAVGFGGLLPGAGPTPGATNDPGGGMASCLAYDPALLPTFDVVFDGTVNGINGDQVTFQVNHGWKGASGSITLTAPDTSVALIGPMPDFQVGGRYLVTAASGNINGCGWTLDYEAGAAADWAAAFGD